ncbi:Lipoprotein (SmpA/OmlA family) [Granulibacter bethesdensis]|uniref:Lipoprotein (SmpA/OmlA family) n=1 Tax=Granulibacter bethesdensis TaxID=364410 RepID=A0AAC9P8L1_9PROT|nr:outer membrane protein assembly factor BamE [Granulibacter bethesdensis]APH54305.1 Lipoprotein (SmpA/OmlA family) [Granulibacter bethesdensis]APH61890.1 Lipoprotein (SmpA/OmlA family) [Granulibacter bethesdensis]
MRRTATISRALAALTLSATLLGGCSFFAPDRVVRGNKVDVDLLKELTPGTSTQADVASLLGSPTTKATFDNNQWVYITQTTEMQIAGTNDILQQNVVTISFDQNGVLKNIKLYGKDDAAPVSVVRRATPSPGSEASWMQQLFGNVGRFNAGGMGGGAGNAPGGRFGGDR